MSLQSSSRPTHRCILSQSFQYDVFAEQTDTSATNEVFNDCFTAPIYNILASVMEKGWMLVI